MDIDKAFRFSKYHVCFVGAGGTGARAFRDFMGFAYSLRLTDFKDVKVTLVDNDVVESNNILRQPFCPDDIGRYKAEVLAERYSSAYNFDISFYTERVQEEEALYSILNKYFGYVPILVGCVDNISTRKLFHRVFIKFASTFVWLDSGNEMISGQVIMGVKVGKDKTLFPCVTQLFPEILDQEDPPVRVSCSNVPITNIKNMSQYLITNMTAATTVVNFLSLIMLEMDINTQHVNFDVSNVSVKPEYINYNTMATKQTTKSKEKV